ncbi:20150_t:CDS:2 [Gigaspora margarita]|uniref:20150_t:CDS:1 n=1 Tax=Gigaspora margarita TaxID=4874 RepID=A0ABM8VZC9_GIGMA|nr:20150_t:CDS:2 [Gigaspora margarita]
MEYSEQRDYIIVTYKKAHWSTKNRRFSSYNEDSISIDLELGKQYSQAKGFSFFGVYDGHRVNAQKVSEMCSKKLPIYIAENLSRDSFRGKTNISVKNAIKKGFEKTDQYLKLGQLSKEFKDVGSTALIAVMTPLKDLIIDYVGDSPAFISSNRLSAQITKEHDLHNKSEVVRLRTQKKHCGLRYSIKRLASNKREKYWECKSNMTLIVLYVFTKLEFANQIYNTKYLDLLVLCSDGIIDQLRAYKRKPTEVLLSYMMQYKNNLFKSLLELACKDLINLCDSISKSEYCTDDISIIIIVFKNGRSFRKWHEDATKSAEDSKVWMNSKTIDEKDLSDISEQDLYEVKPSVKNNIFDIYDTSNQYSAEEAENFANMTVPDL